MAVDCHQTRLMFVHMRYEMQQKCVAKLRSGSCPQKTLFIADHMKLWASQRGKHAVTAALLVCFLKIGLVRLP